MALSRYDFTLKDSTWVDLVSPTRNDFKKLSESVGLPKRVLENSLAPEHLPSFEEDEENLTIFLRVIDPSKKVAGDSVQDLTTKIAFFIRRDQLITIHRMDPDFLVDIREKVVKGEISTFLDLLKILITKSLESYSEALDDLEIKTGSFEEKIFSDLKYRGLIREGYLLKRRASAYRKVLKFSLDILKGITGKYPDLKHDFLGSREILERNIFYTDEILESVTGLLSLHISLSSQKTNEVMRVLTVFSLFFLPLNFIVGIYGMNFTHMPELNWEYGYPAIICLMILVSIIIYRWVYTNGWLKGPNESL